MSTQYSILKRLHLQSKVKGKSFKNKNQESTGKTVPNPNVRKGKGKGKVRGKGKKNSNDKENDECFHCGKLGHWKRKYPDYLATKKRGIIESLIIEVSYIDSTSNTWIIDS